jgi:hypothetical protein
MSGDAGLAAATAAASDEFRKLLRDEAEAARKSGQAARWLPVLASLLAAFLGAGSSYFVARDKAASEFAQLRLAAITRITEIERQAATAAANAAYQRMFDSVFAAEDHGRLNRALAVATLSDLVPENRREGICRYLASIDADARLRSDDPEPSRAACRQQAILVLNPPAPERAAAAIEVAVAAIQPRGSAAPPAPLVPAAVVRSIANLGSAVAAERLAAARDLSVRLNDGGAATAERLAVLEALTATTEMETYRALTPNGRYNTFVVLSEMQPLIRAADASPDRERFRAILALLRRNAEAIRSASANVPDLAGPQTLRQIVQTIDRLPR